MTSLSQTLAELEYDEPSWLHPVEEVEPADASATAAFLNGLDREDFGLFVLAYGMGMRLGEVSQALRLDPALVVWRLRRALHRAPDVKGERGMAALELGTSELLRHPELADDAPPPTHGEAWSLPDLVKGLDDEVRARLEARLAPPGDVSRAGVGVGVVVLVLLVAAGFMVFGAIRDVNPLWRGKDLMADGKFAQAIESLEQYWDPVLAQEQIGLCHLALGEYDAALEAFAYPGVAERLGSFAPVTERLPSLDFEPGRALLPRGLIRNSEPTFVFRAGPPGRLGISVGWGEQTVGRMTKIEDSREGPPIVKMAYPEEWPTLVPDQVVVWAIEDPNISQAEFQCMDREERLAVRSDCLRFLDRSIPAQAHWFFRGHYFMRKKLFTQAGDQFAMLTDIFPRAEYPREMVKDVSRILGVDPQAFLR